MLIAYYSVQAVGTFNAPGPGCVLKLDDKKWKEDRKGLSTPWFKARKPIVLDTWGLHLLQEHQNFPPRRESAKEAWAQEVTRPVSKCGSARERRRREKKEEERKRKKEERQTLGPKLSDGAKGYLMISKSISYLWYKKFLMTILRSRKTKHIMYL